MTTKKFSLLRFLLKWISILSSCLFFFIPAFNQALFVVIMSMPLLGLLLRLNYRPGLETLIDVQKKKSGNYFLDVVDFIEFPGIIGFFKVLLVFSLPFFHAFWLPFLCAFLGYIGLLYLSHKPIETANPHKGNMRLILIVHAALYAFTLVHGLNCGFDQSKPTIYQAVVKEKPVKIRIKVWFTHFLRPEPWGPNQCRRKVSVSRKEFERASPGDIILIRYQNGLLGIPHFRKVGLISRSEEAPRP